MNSTHLHFLIKGLNEMGEESISREPGVLTEMKGGELSFIVHHYGD